jgi:hypothetical protein
VTVPTCEPAGQDGLASSPTPLPGVREIDASAASEHSCTPASLASIPGGRVTDSPAKWHSWLAQNVGFSKRSARLYMQLAADPSMADRQGVADLSLRAAAKSVATPRRPERNLAAAATGSDSGDGDRRPEDPQASPTPELTPSDGEPEQPRQANAARGPTLDLDRISRVRGLLQAIDSLLARANTVEQSDSAAVEMLSEAANAAEAVTSELKMLASDFSRTLASARPAA